MLLTNKSLGEFYRDLLEFTAPQRTRRRLLIADIGIVKVGGILKVVSASLWDAKHYRDFPGVLEGMEGEIYDNYHEIRHAVKQILDDLNVDCGVKIHYYDLTEDSSYYPPED